MALWLVLTLLLLGVTLQAAAEDKSNGFNSNIAWLAPADMRTFDYASNTKPIVHIFSQPWCGACKRLKEDFTNNGQSVVDASSDFVMVSIGGETETDQFSGKEYQPDGGYIPRILFAEPNGKLRTDIKNEGGNPQYAYYYTSADNVAQAMAAAKRKLTAASRPIAEL
ncbi:hypothetical protein WJX72_003926 [[Myrmecia] bisecta]|uniref:Thioredoxin domain-containing protein n=1 Tax=[Myrmecia] bisecta TaxID=41462 RepID=A0AAW1PNQ6_9CHLO